MGRTRSAGEGRPVTRAFEWKAPGKSGPAVIKHQTLRDALDERCKRESRTRADFRFAAVHLPPVIYTMTGQHRQIIIRTTQMTMLSGMQARYTISLWKSWKGTATRRCNSLANMVLANCRLTCFRDN